MASPNLQEQQGTLSRDQVQPAKRLVTSGAQTLTVAQSGTLCLFNTAAGYTYTLPAPTANDVGTTFEFLCTVTNTSTVAKVITDSASTFLLGEIYIASGGTPGATTGPLGFACNGTTHRAINQGGADTTTGGIIGSRFKVTLVTATQWFVEGLLLGSATVVTPVATS